MDFKVDFQKIIENVKEKIFSWVKKIVNFYETERKKAILIVCVILFVLLSILVFALLSEKKDTKPLQIQEKLELSETPLIPDDPVLPKNYNIYRKNKDQWTDENVEEWFTIPSEKEIEALKKSNNAIVNEIIGAAP